tara:strand:- start:180 stop:341 length:162 start_codon:yes stop_codon:yes gene_type:complete
MNYKKIECPNCQKEFRKMIDADWVNFCSDKCEDEFKGSRKTFRENVGAFWKAS